MRSVGRFWNVESKSVRTMGYFDSLEAGDGSIGCSGWLRGLEASTTRAALIVGGHTLAEGVLHPREDVSDALGERANRPYGFRFVNVPFHSSDEFADIEIRLQTKRSSSLFARFFFRSLPIPTPPDELRRRVGGADTQNLWQLGARLSFGDFHRYLPPHVDEGALLDWGSGPGRLTSALARYLESWTIVGADIDPEAVGWANANISRATFVTTSPHPPLPFESSRFDVVTALSVFTHLTAEVQQEWLLEMKRVLRRGGILIATVHGLEATRRIDPIQLPELHGKGFSDSLPDAALDGIAPVGYYRGIFQTEAWTRRVWGKTLNIVSYVAGGHLNMQDMVVLQRSR